MELAVLRFGVGLHRGAWQDFSWLQASMVPSPGGLLARMVGRHLLVMDELLAPLLPLAALLYFPTIIVTSPTKIRRFSFAWTLLSETLLLAAFSCREPWVIIGLLAAEIAEQVESMRAAGQQGQDETKRDRENDSELHVWNS